MDALVTSDFEGHSVIVNFSKVNMSENTMYICLDVLMDK